MEIGYVGLGVMGGALARRLSLSRRVHVFDRSPKAMDAAVAAGGIAADSLTDLARTCDVVLLCLPRSANVREAIFGPDGLLEGLAPGKILIDQTSGDPTETRQIAAELGERGVHMLDAPVSGGVRGADAGTIAIMVGGAPEDVAAVRPVFEAISPNVTHCGEIGAGQVLKLVNNTISTCNRLAMLEAVALGIKNGLDSAVMHAVLNTSGAKSKATENLLSKLVKGEQSATFSLALMLKDLNLANQLAMDSGTPLLFGQLARGMLQMAATAYGPEANLDEIATLVGTQAQVDFTSKRLEAEEGNPG